MAVAFLTRISPKDMSACSDQPSRRHGRTSLARRYGSDM
jgi:hypothetical protein